MWTFPKYRAILLFLLSGAIAALLYACSVGNSWEKAPEPSLPGNASGVLDSSGSTTVPVGSVTASAKRSVEIPLDNWTDRMTKKTFWTKISPKNSPVSPEKFTGFHTGTDFETLPAEKDMEVFVRAICSGKLVLKKQATGYGGMAFQRCNIDGQEVGVIYGHLKLDSISTVAGASLEKGQVIGILGQGFSTETDGERKHLHLGIHRGMGTDIRGYAATAGELSGWLDPKAYLEALSKQ